MADIFSIIGSALNAQDERMGVIASNLANASSITPPGGTPYYAHEVVFQAQQIDPADDGPLADAAGQSADDGEIAGDGTAAAGGTAAGTEPDLGVGIAGTVLSNATPTTTYDPGNPYADASGYVTGSNVSQVGQMVDLIDSSNSYAADIAVIEQAGRVDQQMLSSFQVSS